LAVWLFSNGARFGIQPIEGMAIGVLAGGLLQAMSQIPTLYRSGYRWQKRQSDDPTWYQDPYLKKMLFMMIPGTIGLAATQVSILVNTILATGEGPGAVSWLSYAFRLMQFPIGVFGVSIATAILPRISQHWVNKHFEEAKDSLAHSLRQVFAINLPASAGLIFLGLPIIQLLFQYGAFYYEDAQKTAMALAMYSVGLTAYSGVKVLVPACYAMGNTRVPVLSSVLSVMFAIVLNLITVRIFGYWSLALGTSIAAVLNFSMLIRSVNILLAEKNAKMSFAPLLISFIQNLFSSIAMGICCLFTYKLLNYGFPDNYFMEEFGRKAIFLSRLIKVTFVSLEGIAITFVIAHMFGLQDTILAGELLLSKVKKKLRRIST
ncbi:MAG: lipid II flippase MurJ, partial [Bdellovibrionota bacterium]